MESKLQTVMLDNDSQSLKRKNTRDTQTLTEEQSIQNIQLSHTTQPFITNHHIQHNQQLQNQDASFCRICLENQVEGNRLIKSCSCRDLIHQKCLLEWIQHRNQVVEISENMKCQICKNIESFLTFTCEIFKQKYQHYRKQFARSIVQFLIFFALFVLSAVVLAEIYLSSTFSHRVEQLVNLPGNTIVALIVMIVLFLGIFSIGLFYRLILEYCYGIGFRIKHNNGREEAL